MIGTFDAINVNNNANNNKMLLPADIVFQLNC